jgi:hypothetical protein
MKLIMIIAALVAVVLVLRTGFISPRAPTTAPEVSTDASPSPAAPPAAPHPATTARAEAVRLYPALSQQDSPLNRTFLSLYDQTRQTDPKALADPSWPLTLAARAAAALSTPPPIQKPTKIRSTFDGEIQQISTNGALVHGWVWTPDPTAPANYAGGHYRSQVGDYFIHGLGRGMADGDSCKVYVEEAEVYSYTTVTGARRTVRAFTVSADQSAPPQPAQKPGAWKWQGGSALDKRPQ